MINMSRECNELGEEIKRLNEYEIEKKIGRGSYSVIRRVKRWFLDENGV